MKRTQTIYPKSVRKASEASNLVFKQGKGNSKLGDIISRGHWKGLKIYALTLSERTTCPKSCHHWDDCFGNNMPFAHRHQIKNKADYNRLSNDLATLNQKHPIGFAIRLHVLGDFQSLPYVAFWANALKTYPKIRVFGFTAHKPQTKIGQAIQKLNLAYPDRFYIRFSRSQESTIEGISYAAEESFEGSSFDCPEQTGKVKSCADCGLCWTAKKTVRFLSH